MLTTIVNTALPTILGIGCGFMLTPAVLHQAISQAFVDALHVTTGASGMQHVEAAKR